MDTLHSGDGPGPTPQAQPEKERVPPQIPDQSAAAERKGDDYTSTAASLQLYYLNLMSAKSFYPKKTRVINNIVGLFLRTCRRLQEDLKDVNTTGHFLDRT